MKKDNQTERCFKILELLFTSILDGMSNKEIIEKTSYQAVNTCRDLGVLQKTGWIEKTEKGRWVLTVKPVALMRKYEIYMDELGRRTIEFKTRVESHARRY